MKFISLQENLKHGLLIVSNATSKNINLPILNNILIKAKDNIIQLVSTNLEIGIVHNIRGKIDNEGEFTVNSRVITDYVNLLPGDKVSIEEKDGELLVECQNYKTKVKGQEAKEFPLLPSVEKDGFYEVDVVQFKKALAQVVFAVSNNELRLELSGVFFSFSQDGLTLAATDSYRLAEKRIRIKSSNIKGDKKVIVPVKTAQDLTRIISLLEDFGEKADEGQTVKIYLSDNQILFSFKSTELISRVISGQYPDYQQIIPSEFKTSILVDRQELTRAVKASAIFSKTGINDINLIFFPDKNETIISSASGQTGESSTNLQCSVTGENNDATVNFRYLLDGLNNIETKKIKIEVINNSTPCLIKGEGDDSYLYIIMPIRQ